MILGTVQLGTKYGINNITGQPTFVDSLNLLKEAYESGIRILDTAPGYGNAEGIIGAFHRIYKPLCFEVCSKLPPDILTYNLSQKIESRINNMVETTLQSTGVDQLYCYYLHRFEHCKMDEIMEGICSIKKAGLTRFIGVSIYTPEELNFLSKHLADKIDIVQIPINVFSRHLWDEALINAQCAKMTIFARSIYLQGLAFMDPDEAFPTLLGASKYIRALQDIADKYEQKIENICYASIMSIPSIEEVLIGCETKMQLRENMNLTMHQRDFPPEALKELAMRMVDVPNQVINPTMWKQYQMKVKV